LFFSNPEDFGVEGWGERPYLRFLEEYCQVAFQPPKNDDRLEDSAVQTVGSPAIGEVQEENLGEKPSAAGEVESLGEKPHVASAGE